MKKLFIATMVALCMSTSVNAQSFWGKLKNAAKSAVTNVVANNTVNNQKIDTLYVMHTTPKKMYTNVEVSIKPDGNTNVFKVVGTDIMCTYYNSSIKKDGDNIQLIKDGKVIYYVFRKNNSTQAIYNIYGIE